MTEETPEDVTSPVHAIASETVESPRDGLALCLSGGGYRAMLFHVGVLWRLNETRQLPKLDRISSVSGGSITAGVLAKNWSALEFVDGMARNFVEQCVSSVRVLASTPI